MMMSGHIGILVVLIYGGMIAVPVFLLILLSRFVKASERLATAAEAIARKHRDDSRQ